MKKVTLTLIIAALVYFPILSSAQCDDEYIGLKDFFKEAYELYGEGMAFPEFVHNIFTSSGPINGDVDGSLNIPYFWNWGDYNPRHEIVYLPENKQLNKVKPPKEFSRYQNFADFDRVPKVFWSDFVSEKPLYEWNGMKFKTFGWCSEREMAFLSLMREFGYNGHVIGEGAHVWTQLTDGESMWDIDNTFNHFYVAEENQSGVNHNSTDGIINKPGMLMSVLFK